MAELRGDLSISFIDRLIHHSFTAEGLVELLSPEQRHAIIAVISFVGSSGIHSFGDWEIAQAISRYS